MPNRSIKFTEGEYYHVYNRGVDKRDIFSNNEDFSRFLKCLDVLNTKDPIGSLYEYSFIEKSKLGSRTPKLVNIVCFCLNPNHYHLLLKQVGDRGISKFMQRLGTAHSNYFNEKYKRSGALFQGKFKAIHVDSNEYLLHLSAYINLNFDVHSKWRGKEKSATYSSWDEYCGKSSKSLCNKKIILEQFSSVEEYKLFALDALTDIKERKDDRFGSPTPK